MSTNTRTTTCNAAPAVLLALALAACGHSGGADTDTATTEDTQAGTTADGETTSDTGADTDTDAGLDPNRPFEPPSPMSALHKVKTFLTGLAPTDAEYAAYANDPSVLPGLIDGWIELPEFEPRAKEMFSFMFQQSARSDDIGLIMREQNTDVFQQREGRGGVDLEAPMRESWALTAWDLVSQDRPFTEVATTRTFHLNVPLMMAMAYVDATPRDDTNSYAEGYSWLEALYPDFQVRYTQDQQIPFEDSVDPDSPNYGLFTIGEPDGSAANTSACDGLKDTFTGRKAIEEVYKTMMGVPFRTTCWSWNGAMANVFEAPGDLDMRPIHVRLAEPGETPTVFWDLAGLRSADELVLTTEYVGFFGTFGFLTQWTTNAANEYRVTANQTLIVGLGRSFDPGGLNIVIDELAPDEQHAAPDTVCYSCHVELDPLRDFFRHSYTYWGGARIDGMGQNEAIPPVASFRVDGSDPVEGVGVADLGAAIAGSQRFAPAWTEKLCGLANAGYCLASDPELARVTDVFSKSGHNFKVLLRELLSSPIVTYQERTKTWDLYGATVGAALQDDLCRRLGGRAGIHDACALKDELDLLPGERDRIAGYARVLAELGYPRGAVAPDQPIVATLFSTLGAESLCEALAEHFLGGTGQGQGPDPLFTAEDRAQAIEFFLHELMGVWSADPHAGELEAVLNEHWDAVVESGGSEDEALQSTFVLACAAPQTTSLGL